MKTNIVGWLYIITSPIFIFPFFFLTISPILFNNGIIDSLAQPVLGIASLIIAIFGFILGSALRKHKRWSWYAVIILMPLALIGNLLTLVTAFRLFLFLPIAVEIFSIYALISEKNIFL